jgi:hypothetical protein
MLPNIYINTNGVEHAMRLDAIIKVIPNITQRRSEAEGLMMHYGNSAARC